MKFYLLLAGALGLAQLSTAQIQLSVEGGGQYSLLTDYSETVNEIVPMPGPTGFYNTYRQYPIHHQFENKLGAYLQANLQYGINTRVNLYHNLGVTLNRFNYSTRVDFGDNINYEREDAGGGGVFQPEGPRTGYTTIAYPTDERIGNTSLVYISQQVGGQYKLAERWSLRSGLALRYLVHAQEYQVSYRYTPGPAPQPGEPMQPTEGELYVYKDTSRDAFSPLQLGLEVGASFQVLPRLAINGQAQQFLTSTYEKTANKARPAAFSLGIEYRLKSW